MNGSTFETKGRDCLDLLLEYGPDYIDLPILTHLYEDTLIITLISVHSLLTHYRLWRSWLIIMTQIISSSW
jgi:hypothetical protein